MWTLVFWKAILERALSTAAQALLGVVLSVATLGQIDWRVVASTVGIATLASVLKGIAAAVFTDGSPSMNGAETLTQPSVPQRAVIGEPAATPPVPPATPASTDGPTASTPS